MRAELERLYDWARAEQNTFRLNPDVHSVYRGVGDRIRAILTASDWIPVSERLPELAGWYLGCYVGPGYQEDASFPVYWFDAEWCGGNTSDSDRGVEVTHWQELPAPYRAEGGGG